MNMHQEYTNSGDNNWPSTNQPSEPRYKAPAGYSDAVWTENAAVHNIPLPILQRAERRVAAQRAFFKHLFIYAALVSVSWLIGISGFIENYQSVTIFVPIIISVLGGLRVAWSFFNAFIWEEKTQQERVLHEARKMMS